MNHCPERPFSYIKKYRIGALVEKKLKDRMIKLVTKGKYSSIAEIIRIALNEYLKDDN